MDGEMCILVNVSKELRFFMETVIICDSIFVVNYIIGHEF